MSAGIRAGAVRLVVDRLWGAPTLAAIGWSPPDPSTANRVRKRPRPRQERSDRVIRALHGPRRFGVGAGRCDRPLRGRQKARTAASA